MNKNKLEGTARAISGKIKDVAGGLTGNHKLRAEGALENAVGTVQSAVGKAQDKLAKSNKP